MAKTYKVIETSVGIIRIEEGRQHPDTMLMCTALENGKVKVGKYETADGETKRVVQMNSEQGAFCSFSVEHFEKLKVKVINGWACVLAKTLVRPTDVEFKKEKEVLGSTLL